MKKIFALILCILLFCLTIYGCGTKEGNTSTTKKYDSFSNSFTLRQRDKISSGEYAYDISSCDGDFVYLNFNVDFDNLHGKHVVIRIIKVDIEIDYTTLETMDLDENSFVNPRMVEITLYKYVNDKYTEFELNYLSRTNTYESEIEFYGSQTFHLKIEKIP